MARIGPPKPPAARNNVTAKPYNVLFLCTGNSARSILAEATINHLPMGLGRFRGLSAGSHPRGEVQPMALELLRSLGISTEGLRSKSWEEFAQHDSPRLDFVLTVCDRAAAESCPIWPGQPMTAHWGVPDPAAAEGDDEARRRAYREAYLVLRRRIELMVSLPIEGLDRLALQDRLAEIGEPLFSLSPTRGGEGR
jgi:protein-tyrosine-phosphatase